MTEIGPECDVIHRSELERLVADGAERLVAARSACVVGAAQ